MSTCEKLFTAVLFESGRILAIASIKPLRELFVRKSLINPKFGNFEIALREVWTGKVSIQHGGNHES